MNTRKPLLSVLALVACMSLALTTSFGDDLLGKKKGGGGGGSSSGGSSSGGSSDQGRRGGGGGGGGSSSGGGNNSGGSSDQGGRRGGGGGGGNSGGGSSGGGSNSGGGGTEQRGGGSSGGSGSSGGGQRGGGGNEGGRRGGGGSSGGGNNSGGGSNDGGRGNGGNSGGGSNQGSGEIRRGGSQIIIGGGNNSGDVLGKRGNGTSSRSGNVNYGGSNSNLRNKDRNGGPVVIGRAPVDVVRGSLGNQVRRADEIRIGSTRIRFGYTHYDYRWCDDNFYYPYYAFDPYRSNVVCSPWYYYASLPPYYNSTRCTFVNTYIWSPFAGVRYIWNQPSNYNNGYGNYNNGGNRSYGEFDYVIDDIVNAFERNDRRAVGRLAPRDGRVAIIIDGQYAYSVNGDDFYDTMLDATANTRTRDYQILDVQTRRDTAAVWARHDYEDPWGRRTSVYHYYKLELDGRDWVIREFGTSDHR